MCVYSVSPVLYCFLFITTYMFFNSLTFFGGCGCSYSPLGSPSIHLQRHVFAYWSGIFGGVALALNNNRSNNRSLPNGLILVTSRQGRRGIINIIIGNSRRNINDDMVPFQWIDGRHSVCVVVTSLAYLLYFLWPCPEDPWMDSSADSLVTMLTSKTRTKSSESSSYFRHPPLLLLIISPVRPSRSLSTTSDNKLIRVTCSMCNWSIKVILRSVVVVGAK